MKRLALRTTLLMAIILQGFVLGLAGCGSADLVDFVQFHSITYLTNGLQVEQAHNVLHASDLGPVFAKVRFKLEGSITMPWDQVQDGDAAYLDAGTPVYTVKGYASTFRLAAYEQGKIVLFEADTNPNAKTGADLLDIDGKVQSIAVLNDQEAQLAMINNPKLVENLSTMVLNAPVDQSRASQSEPQYVIVFYLKDGTVVERVYTLNSGELARGIYLPKAFGTIIQEAVRK